MKKSIVPYKKLLLTVIAWSVIVVGYAFLTWNRLHLKPDTAYGWIDARHLHSVGSTLLDFPARWDSEWYLSIVREGYSFKGIDQMSNIVFFPVYPFFTRVLNVLVGNVVLSGWLVSVISLMVGVIYLWRLVKEFHKDVNPDEVIQFALVFPTAIFFLGIYTESVFFALSIACFYYIRKKQWLVAALLGAVAALTRLTGILLLIPFAIEALLEWRASKKFVMEWLAGLLLPLATAGFFLYHQIAFGSWSLFFALQKVWGRGFAINYDHLYTVTAAGRANLLLDVLFVLLGLVLCAVVAKRIRVSYAAYVLAGILVPLSSGTLMSIGRYLLVLFPIYLALATYSESTKRMYVVASTLLLGLYTTLFVHSYWAG